MPFCFQCGAKIDDDQIFCMSCGCRVAEAPEGKTEPAVSGPIEHKQTTDMAPNVEALIQRGYMALEDGSWDDANGFFNGALNQNARNAKAYLGLFLSTRKIKSLDSYVAQCKTALEAISPSFVMAGSPDNAHIEDIVSKYAVSGYLEKGNIRRLYDYNLKYSSLLSKTTDMRNDIISDIDGDTMLSRARQFSEGEDKEIIENAVSELKTYSDSLISRLQDIDSKNAEEKMSLYQEHLAKADAKTVLMYEKAVEKRENDYNTAINEFNNASSEASLRGLSDRFSKFGDYKEALAYSDACFTKIEEIKRQLDERKTSRIVNENKRKRKTAIVFLSVFVGLAVVIAGIIIFINYGLPFVQYNSAKKLMNEGNYHQAIDMFRKTGGYKDSYELITDIYFDHPYLIAEGEEIPFGEYKGQTLFWYVADVSGDRVLLINCTGVEEIRFDDDSNDWRTSELREWLNDDFYDDSFSSSEKRMLIPDYEYGDLVFAPTKYQCELISPYLSGHTTSYSWWLRDPDSFGPDYVVTGYTSGSVVYLSDHHIVSNTYDMYVRPAIWIQIDD